MEDMSYFPHSPSAASLSFLFSARDVKHAYQRGRECPAWRETKGTFKGVSLSDIPTCQEKVAGVPSYRVLVGMTHRRGDVWREQRES